MADFLEFESLSSWSPRGRGRIFVVENPAECQDFKHLIGRDAAINGDPYFITAVEHFAHAPPYRAGEKIGLVVRSRDVGAAHG